MLRHGFLLRCSPVALLYFHDYSAEELVLLYDRCITARRVCVEVEVARFGIGRSGQTILVYSGALLAATIVRTRSPGFV